MKRIAPLPSFERSIRHLNVHEKKLLTKSLEAFNGFLMTGNAPYGFRLKKIGQGKYEFRINLSLRVVVKLESSIYYLVLAGNHDDVRQHLLNS